MAARTEVKSFKTARMKGVKTGGVRVEEEEGEEDGRKMRREELICGEDGERSAEGQEGEDGDVQVARRIPAFLPAPVPHYPLPFRQQRVLTTSP